MPRKKAKTFPRNFPIHICWISLAWRSCNISTWCPGFAPLSFTPWKEEIFFHFFTTLILAESRWWTWSWQQLRGQCRRGQPRKKKRLRHLGAKRTRQGWRMKRAGYPLYPSPVLFPSRCLGTFQPTTKMPPKIKRICTNSSRRSKKKKFHLHLENDLICIN